MNDEKLSEDLGIFDTTIQQHIRELQDLGYHISETDKGYHLTNEPDVLFPWEFEKRESHIHYFSEVNSTMDVARNMAKDDCPHFTVIIAESQTKGRGRLKRKWISEEGGLYFTIVLRPDVPITLVHMVNFCASLSLAKILQNHFSLNAKVKWPNDVLVDDKKISGLLSEMEADDNGIYFVNIGIGINVNNDPALEEPNATSLKKLLGKDVLRKTILSLFLDEFENSLNLSNVNKIMSQWKKYTMTLGKEVRIVTSRETTEGTAIDVDESGALILKLEDGSLKKIIYGDCFVR
ncbi:MAG: biotin--[acetyl-CoA-carboxylase] ligase [Deltaproteobacteria bacterium]|nr:biotin--[acetyl-CoA-carboxylase] ligase [Deltaproteobacteria bacterium]MBW1846571.1 biotin--[acetyl-CoA-carboxylase] ligase [Deltaproteobacteria bacterium]